MIALEVSIRFRDNLLWDETATRILHVRVGDGPFPWPAGWHGGDLHVHSMFTNNIAEWGAPLPALAAAAAAAGLRWVAVTDHSCDLDQTEDGAWSYVTRLWRCTVQTPAGEQTFVRDVFAADGSTWGGLTAEIAADDRPGLRLLRGVEINLASVDPATAGRTLHALFLDAGYLASPLSGAPGERPVFPTVPAGLDALAAASGFAFAAHPWDDLAGEWDSVDLGVERRRLGRTATSLPPSRALSSAAWSCSTPAPWSAPAPRTIPGPTSKPASPPPTPTPPLCWPGSNAGTPFCAPAWPTGPRVAWCSPAAATPTATSTTPPTSPSTTGPTTTLWARSRPCSACRAPGAPATPPPAADLLAALRDGHSLITDGPFLELALDADRDGSPDGPTDLHPGDAARVNPATCPPLLLRWASLPEFGSVALIRLLAITPTGVRELDTRDPRLCGQPFTGIVTFPLTDRALTGPVALRAELTTADNAAGHRACTNPLWLDFNPVTATDPGDPADPADFTNAARPDAALSLAPTAPNPAVASTTIRFRLGRPAPVTLTIHDLAGRRLRRLLDASPLPAGPHTAVWDGRDDGGAPVANGVYLVRLTAGGQRRGGLVQMLR